jgi:hypothetical protein
MEMKSGSAVRLGLAENGPGAGSVAYRQKQKLEVRHTFYFRQADSNRRRGISASSRRSRSLQRCSLHGSPPAAVYRQACSTGAQQLSSTASLLARWATWPLHAPSPSSHLCTSSGRRSSYGADSSQAPHGRRPVPLELPSCSTLPSLHQLLPR